MPETDFEMPGSDKYCNRKNQYSRQGAKLAKNFLTIVSLETQKNLCVLGASARDTQQYNHARMFSILFTLAEAQGTQRYFVCI
jgi:hypothetical protein